MVQTISSFFFLCIFNVKNYFSYYLPLNQPFTAKDPIRRLEANIDFSTFESKCPLNTTVDNPLNAESMFFNPPFHFNLYTALSAL